MPGGNLLRKILCQPFITSPLFCIQSDPDGPGTALGEEHLQLSQFKAAAAADKRACH